MPTEDKDSKLVLLLGQVRSLLCRALLRAACRVSPAEHARCILPGCLYNAGENGDRSRTAAPTTTFVMRAGRCAHSKCCGCNQRPGWGVGS
jgi:hypothetical protein